MKVVRALRSVTDDNVFISLSFITNRARLSRHIVTRACAPKVHELGCTPGLWVTHVATRIGNVKDTTSHGICKMPSHSRTRPSTHVWEMTRQMVSNYILLARQVFNKKVKLL